MTDLRLIPLEGGKYVLHMDSDGIVRVDRYADVGWRKLSIGVGDKMVSALFNRLYDLEDAVKTIRNVYESAKNSGLNEYDSERVFTKLLSELEICLTGEDGEAL